MARKNLLQGLMGDTPKANPGETEPKKAPAPRYSKGAIGAVSKSIADLKSRSVIEIDPFEIEAGGLTDRLEHDEEDHARLMASMRDYGQQVPVLVRVHPESPGKYQIVYGRRRVLALRDLGLPVRAMIRDLDDQELVMAQGQENSARRDLSFIERVNFARQMSDAGYDRKVICDALSVDKTVISRMLSVASNVPVEVIETIGAAPGIGRDRWLSFANLWQARGADMGDVQGILGVTETHGSDARFEAIFAWLSGPKPEAAKPRPRPQAVDARRLTGDDGAVIAEVRPGKKGLAFEFTGAAGGFDTWLAERLEDLHRDWMKTRGK